MVGLTAPTVVRCDRLASLLGTSGGFPCDRALVGKAAIARAALPGMEPKRADVILAGGVVVAEAMRATGFGRLVVSDRGNLRLRRIDLAAGQVTTIAGDGNAGGDPDGTRHT